jgi:hypothetical protein
VESEGIMARSETEEHVLAALQALERKLDTSLGEVACAVQSLAQQHFADVVEQERRNAGFATRADVVEAMGAATTRAARIEDELLQLRDQVAQKQDVLLLTNRIERLASKIDVLAMNVAGHAPRLDHLEQAVADLRGTMVPRGEVEGIEQRIGELALRLDASDQSQTTRSVGLSNQVNAWLVSLLLLVVGALASYLLMMGGHR